jgi:hypothetical protein
MRAATFRRNALALPGADEAFFVPPYVGPKGWIGVRIVKGDTQEITELVTEAWRMTAPRRAVLAFDEDGG